MTDLEKERVASLANHPGFKALLKLLDEADEILLQKLETSHGAEETAQLSLWRGSRRFKRIVEFIPENLAGDQNKNPFEDFS
tara:strand:- start:240 stop:485 length:246 start_codon:yes stop_codon:yes gene_type:complete